MKLVEIDAMLEDDRPFDTEWYETALRALFDRDTAIDLDEVQAALSS